MVSELDYRKIISERDTFVWVQGGYVRQKPKLNNSNMSVGIRKKILCNKNTRSTSTNTQLIQTMSTI
jgi:hypothetical protein